MAVAQLAAAALILFVVPVPTSVSARDNPGDGGGALLVTWDAAAGTTVIGFEVLRQTEGDSWVRVAFVGPATRRFVDSDLTDRVGYRYRIVTVGDGGRSESDASGWAHSSAQWFAPRTTGALVGALVITGLLLWFTSRARRGSRLFLRRISGLDAVEEALGRATEMGRPVLYVPGLSTVSDVATIAAVNILGEVAKKAARFGTPLTVPTADPIVYTVARETVRQSYIEVGRPDAFDPGAVYFLSDDQFAYAAAVDGIMIRERPATNFLIGMFWAESLILAETGAATGAIQIAGTDAVSQLPFFFCACDYTLIGEELYAASAYLSREPLLLGGIKGQDYSKLAITAIVLVGTALALVFGLPTPAYL